MQYSYKAEQCRPHHLACSCQFEGDFNSEEDAKTYIESVHCVQRRLRENTPFTIEVAGFPKPPEPEPVAEIPEVVEDEPESEVKEIEAVEPK